MATIPAITTAPITKRIMVFSFDPQRDRAVLRVRAALREET
jgi:hypothetical protein